MSASDIRRFSAAELKARRARGEDESDLPRVRAMTEDELEAAIDSDPDWKDVPEDWFEEAIPVLPGPKKLLSLRVDPDVLDWFRAQGPGYQTRMNAVLRAYMKAASKR